MERPFTGLTQEEAARRLARFGPNRVPGAPPRPLWRRWLAQFRHPLVLLLLFALALNLALWLAGREPGPHQALMIAAILIVNAGLSTWQEHRTERALARLRRMVPVRVWVLRDGRWRPLDPAALVPGDVVRLEAGDRVPADGVLLEADGATFDESLVTGESVPVPRPVGAEVVGGSLLVAGTAIVRIERTGPESGLGRIAGMLREVEETPAPLERRLERFGRRLAVGVLVLAAVLTAVGLLAWGVGAWPRVVLFGVALAVAAVPEGLPAMLALTLALGAERMVRRKALVRRLGVVEALGSVTLIATDKTGTLTENRLRVERLEASDEIEVLRAAWIASPSPADPVDRALATFARERLGSLPELERVDARPFDARWAFVRVTVRVGEDRISYFKGAPEVLLERTRMTDPERRRWAGRAAELSREGYKVLGLARAAGEREEGLEWLGLVALLDPPRPEVPDAVRAARRAGVRVVMLTGDHPETALKIAVEVGIPADRALTSRDLASMDDTQLAAAVRGVHVFARLKPEDKLRLVRVFRAQGEVVGVTGDGVNDAPALKAADVGVAMGLRGSEVAKEVADLVLLDDNFATIVAAVEEGRNVGRNVRAFLTLLLATNLSEVLVVSLGVLLATFLNARDGLPLTAAQILWINLVTDSFLALALAGDRARGLLERPPDPPDRPLLDQTQRRFVVWAASVTAAAVLALRFGLPEATARTLAFHALVLLQAGVVFAVRRLEGVPGPNRWVPIAVAGVVGLQGLAASWSWLRRALDLAPLTPPAALAVVALAAAFALVAYRLAAASIFAGRDKLGA